MLRAHLLSIVRGLDTVFTATGIYRPGYVDCLLARAEWMDRQYVLCLFDGASL